MLASALQAYEESLCPCGCGFPRDRAWDSDSDGWYETKPVFCYAKAARDRHEEEAAKQDAREPGEMITIIDTREEESEQNK